jgi:hypothetical protein
MISLLTKCDEDYGRRVSEGIGRGLDAGAREATAAD